MNELNWKNLPSSYWPSAGALVHGMSLLQEITLNFKYELKPHVANVPQVHVYI